MNEALLKYRDGFNVLQGLAEEAPLSLRISGNCMAPVIEDQDLVQVRKQRWYWPGDILAVRLANDQLVCHRLIGIYLRRRQLRFLTQADNARCPDSAVAREQILGIIISGSCRVSTSCFSPVLRLKAVWEFLYFCRKKLRLKVLRRIEPIRKTVHCIVH